VVCGKKFDAAEPAVQKDAGAVADDDMIFDIGPKSAQELADIIMKAGTVVWNGPVGVFEFDQFGEGTKTVAMAIANTKAFTLAGGGDTIAAIQKYDIYDKVSYISTGGAGGAFLEFLEGKVLPAVEILETRANGYTIANIIAQVANIQFLTQFTSSSVGFWQNSCIRHASAGPINLVSHEPDAESMIWLPDALK
jgi:hypothetical protein